MTTVSAEAKLIPKPPALVDNRKQKSCKTKATQQKNISVSGQDIQGQTPFQVMVLLEPKVKENAKKRNIMREIATFINNNSK